MPTGHNRPAAKVTRHTRPLPEGSVTPIYRHRLPVVAWQLLWWMVCNMDELGYVRGGWRSRAQYDIGKGRIWLSKVADKMRDVGLLEYEKGEHGCRVRIENFVGHPIEEKP